MGYSGAWAEMEAHHKQVVGERGIKKIEVPGFPPVFCKPEMKSKELAHVLKLLSEKEEIKANAYVVVYCAVDEDGIRVFKTSDALTIIDNLGLNLVADIAAEMTSHVIPPDDDPVATATKN